MSLLINSYLKIFILTSIFLIHNSCDNKNETKLEYENCLIYSSRFSEKNNLVVISVNFNDTLRSKFLFDTGCSNLIIDSLFNYEHSIVSPNISYVKNSNKKSYFKIDSLPHKFINNDFEIINLYEKLSTSINGVLGISYFMDYSFGLNFDDTTFNFISCSDLQKKYPKYEKNDIIVKNKQIMIMAYVNINGIEISGPFVFDTGSEIDIILSKQTVNEFRLDTLKDNCYYVSNNAHLYGNTNGFFINGSKLMLLNKDFKNPLLFCDNVGSDPISDYNSKECKGLIGMGIINNFNFIINSKENKIYTYRNNRKFKKMKFIGPGIVVVDNRKTLNALKVSGVFIDSEAYNNGLNLGDLILSINGKKVTEMDMSEINKLLTENQNSVTLVYSSKRKIFKRTFKCNEIIN